MRLVEDGAVLVVVVVHVNDIFVIVRKTRCDKCGNDLNAYVPSPTLGSFGGRPVAVSNGTELQVPSRFPNRRPLRKS